MTTQELRQCGTVMSLDLATHDDFGVVVIELTYDQVLRIISVVYDNLPDKTQADKKCKEFLNNRLFPGKIKHEINIIPVLNKKVLKEVKAYRVSKRRAKN